MNDLFSPPEFRPADSLIQLKRSLRDLRPLVERGDGFELQGQRVVELRCDDSFITVRLARRASRSPEWDTQVLKNGADLRKCLDEVKKRLVRWTEE
jgi:hypothetical protein